MNSIEKLKQMSTSSKESDLKRLNIGVEFGGPHYDGLSFERGDYEYTYVNIPKGEFSELQNLKVGEYWYAKVIDECNSKTPLGPILHSINGIVVEDFNKLDKSVKDFIEKFRKNK